MRTTILLIVLALLLTLSGIALAGSAVDLVQPRIAKMVSGVEGLTGWDCQYRIADNQDRFAVLVWCDK